MDDRIGKKVKVVWSDNINKVVVGTIVWESDDFISLIDNKTGQSLDVNKRFIISVEVLV